MKLYCRFDLKNNFNAKLLDGTYPPTLSVGDCIVVGNPETQESELSPQDRDFVHRLGHWFAKEGSEEALQVMHTIEWMKKRDARVEVLLKKIGCKNVAEARGLEHHHGGFSSDPGSVNPDRRELFGLLLATPPPPPQKSVLKKLFGK